MGMGIPHVQIMYSVQTTKHKPSNQETTLQFSVYAAAAFLHWITTKKISGIAANGGEQVVIRCG
jgi:hypothetical protein